MADAERFRAHPRPRLPLHCPLGERRLRRARDRTQPAAFLFVGSTWARKRRHLDVDADPYRHAIAHGADGLQARPEPGLPWRPARLAGVSGQARNAAYPSFRLILRRFLSRHATMAMLESF